MSGAESRRQVHVEHIIERPDAFETYRRSFSKCLHRRGDALFELTDAILAADGTAPSLLLI